MNMSSAVFESEDNITIEERRLNVDVEKDEHVNKAGAGFNHRGGLFDAGETTTLAEGDDFEISSMSIGKSKEKHLEKTISETNVTHPPDTSSTSNSEVYEKYLLKEKHLGGELKLKAGKYSVKSRGHAEHEKR